MWRLFNIPCFRSFNRHKCEVHSTHKRLAFLPLVLLVLPAAVLSQAAPAVLSFDAALRAAEARSKVHLHHAYEAQAARELAVAAGELPDPTLRMSLDNLAVDGPARWSLTREPMTMGSVGLMQTFTREDKRAARAKRYEQEARVADSAVVMQLTNLRRDTAVAWLTRYYRQQILQLLQQQRTEAVILVEATDAAYAAGTDLQVDVFMARTELALIDDRIREATTLLENATTVLSRWIGPGASDPLGAAPAITTTALQSAALEDALTQQPELQALMQQEALAQSEVSVAQLNKRADWTVEFMFSQRDSGFGNMVSVGASIPLQLGRVDKQDRELSAKLAMVEGMRSERTELQRQYLAQVQTWLDSWRSNLDRLDSYDTSIMPLALARTEAAVSSYQGNSTPLTTVLEARRAEVETRLERLRLEMETATLWAQLEFLLPQPTRTSAQQTEQEN